LPVIVLLSFSLQTHRPCAYRRLERTSGRPHQARLGADLPETRYRNIATHSGWLA